MSRDTESPEMVPVVTELDEAPANDTTPAEDRASRVTALPPAPTTLVAPVTVTVAASATSTAPESVLVPLATKSSPPATLDDRASLAPRKTVVEALGSWLRRERELRGFGLEEISDVTRISRQSLEALEDGRYGELPGDVFVRGFLRSYARAVSVSVDEVLARYSSEVRARDVKPLEVRVTALNEQPGRRFGLAIALVVFGILATLAASFLLRPRTQDRPEVLSKAPAAAAASSSLAV